MDRSHIPSGEPRRPIYAFFAFFAALPARICDWFAATWLGRFLGGYDKTCELMEESRAASLFRDNRFTRSLSGLRVRLAVGATSSPLLRWLEKVFAAVRHTPTRWYGLFFTTFGFYSVLVYVIRYFAFESLIAERSVLFTGIALVVLSLPLLFVPRSLGATLQESRILGYLLYRVAGLRMHGAPTKDDFQLQAGLAFLLGSAFGIVGFFVHPLYLLLALFSLILLTLMLLSPEFALLCALFVTPFLFFFEQPSLLLATMILIGAVSYGLKLILGKRLFSFEPTDLCILALMLLYLVSCIFTRGGTASVKEALLACVLLLGYFLAVNLLTNTMLIERAVNALIISGALVALIGILQQLTGNAVADWLDSSAYDYISGRITSTFSNPNMLAVFLILVFPFTVARMLQKSSPLARIGSSLAFLLYMGAIVYTWSRGAWIGVIVSLCILLLICRPLTVYILLPIGIATPILLRTALWPLFERLSSSVSLTDSSVFYRTGIWQGVWQMLADNFVGGIGVGEAAFREVYPYYALSGIEAAPHTHNLYLQFFVAFGVAGPILLVGALLIFFQCILSHQRREENGNLHLMSVASGCGVLAVLINGLFDYVLYSHRIFFLFFAVIGIAVAFARVGRRERKLSRYASEDMATEYSVDIDIS